MKIKSISTAIGIIKSIIEDKENELHYKETTGELCVMLPRQIGTGEYNVIMYHMGTNMMVVRWYDTDISSEVKLYLIPRPDEITRYAMTIDSDEFGLVRTDIEFIPVLTEEEYFQQSTICDNSNVTMEDMIQSVNFMEYVDNLLRSYEDY